MTNKQNQKGGNNSNNYQAEQIIIQTGIDEKRAREVFHEMSVQLRSEYTKEALEIANTRVSQFEECLMPKMEKVEGALEAFADPSFQMLVIDAQKAAASTERPADYELLSELLVHRFQKGESRVARAGIGLAVEIVDKIADDALLGLTVFNAVTGFTPRIGYVHEGLDALEKLFGKILYAPLPTGQEWLDHIDILRAARINQAGSMKKMKEFYPSILPGYVDPGIEKNSENHEKAIKILEGEKITAHLLAEHCLNSSFVRLPLVHKSNTKNGIIYLKVNFNGIETFAPISISESQAIAFDSIYDLYSTDQTIKNSNIESLIKEVNNRPNLKTVQEWWDEIPMAVYITSAGRALAHSNAQRFDSKLPPLD